MKQLYIDFDGVILDTITYPYEYVEKNQVQKSMWKVWGSFTVNQIGDRF